MTVHAMADWSARRHDAPKRHARVPSPVLGTMLFVFSEVMFFSGLISAYLVLRARVGTWPPPGQPRFPVLITGFNTVVLLASAWTMAMAVGALRRGHRPAGRQWLLATLVLGVTFVLIQGYEWVQLINFGLTTHQNIYGSLFYTLIGTHGLHVIAALVTLAMVLRKTRLGHYPPESLGGVLAMRLFWFFVVGIWPVLYVLVYVW